jgi:peptidoglycan/xylan/chitin deacetylase (PgdA/CDA1 family)
MIFMYHNVVPRQASSGHNQQSITLRDQDFKKQVSALNKIYQFVSLEDYLKEWRKKGKQPFLKAVLTIDDGTWATYEYGVNFLIEKEIPSLIFVNTCQIDQGPLIWGAYLNAVCYDSQYEFLEIEGKRFELGTKENREESRRSLVRLARETVSPSNTVLAWSERYSIQEEVLRYYRGMSTEQLEHAGASKFVEIGVHTHTHPFLSTLSKMDQTAEIFKNRTILEEKTRRAIRYMAYPSGDYNNDTLDILKELNFEAACAVHMNGNNKDLIYQLPRVGIYSPSVMRVVASSLKNRLKLKGLRFEE